MKGYIGYIRVSTVKQGLKGVSLIEQRDAILRYAERHGFTITIWLEEMETASKKGRPVFNQALKLLRSGKARGIILHKIDRGARNLRDWTDIGDLSDEGVEIHFVNESIDLQTRGGRLSADIQAVVSADYIRNLREETRKGFYGRLKQGLYPLPAPVGYLNQGKGKPKTIDPIMGPLVRKAFELYSTGNYNLETLGTEMYRLGLRTRLGGKMGRSSTSQMLNNPFYFGLIQIRKTNETFLGGHEPIISKVLYDRVQAVLNGKVCVRTQRHSFQFRKMLTCAVCRYSLIGERQKGHVYYRCHSKQCPKTSIRENLAEAEAAKLLVQVQFSDEEKAYFRPKVLEMREKWTTRLDEEIQSQNLKLAQVKDRLNRLTDAYLDQALDKSMFEERKKALLMEQKDIEGALADLNRRNSEHPNKLENFLELSGTAWLSYQLAFPEERREMLNILTSNRKANAKSLVFEPSIAYQPIVNRFKSVDGAPYRNVPRTWDRILEDLAALSTRGQLPDLSVISGFLHRDDASHPKPNGEVDSTALAE